MHGIGIAPRIMELCSGSVSGRSESSKLMKLFLKMNYILIWISAATIVAGELLKRQ